MPGWVNEGFGEYAKRLPPECALQLQEIPAFKRSRGLETARVMDVESKAMLKVITPAETVIALERTGKSWSTAQLADQFKVWLASGRNLALLVGGPEGLSSECLARADERWSLSALTLPHPLVRIVVAEALYRAWSLLNHHPYHRD